MPKRVTQSFCYDTRAAVIVEGDIYADDHPLVQQFPTMFVDHEVNVIQAPARAVPTVEQATAAPGEVRRGPGRPRKDPTE